MKKKKWLVFSLVTLVCILIVAFTITLINRKRTINDLISQLEDAINKHNIEKIIHLYPDYCKEDVVKYFSQEKLNDFYNNVIVKDSENISVQIVNISNPDISSCDDVMEQIEEQYEQNIIIEDYRLVQIKYHNDFSDSNLQIVKINGDYYLYFYGNLGEPLSYFH